LDAGVRKVLMADYNAEGLEKARSGLLQTYPDAQIELSTVDVSKEEDVKAMVAQAVDKFGRLDYCLNSAGVAGVGKKLGETSLEDVSRDWGHTLIPVRAGNQRQRARNLPVPQVRARADGQAGTAQPVHSCPEKADIRGPRGQRGAIVNIASILGYRGLGTVVAYCTSKHAVIGMTKVAAIDYTGKQIRVNAIAPGWIETAVSQCQGRR
jgi:NAD(P)-dependent dehydrogenase (short-subunit alcohol dehydrogenase family)